MRLRFGLLRFVRGLSGDRSERRRLASAAIRLVRQRRHSFGALRPLLGMVPTFGSYKLQLWQALARSYTVPRKVNCGDSERLFEALSSTNAYSSSRHALASDRNGFMQRGPGYQKLRECWIDQPPERVVVFHHYDRLGWLPRSWEDALQVLQASGWQVVLSTTNLDPNVRAVLEPAGVQVVQRANIGLCLGAYRDLALLLHSTPLVYRRLSSLVLCNDSNLLVQPPAELLAHLMRWEEETVADPHPVLAGLTDSAQLDSYHLQSFLLYANRALLRHPAWLSFWLKYAIDLSKTQLIDQGEIGLSQTLLAAGVKLRPAYSLVHGLLDDPTMAEELKAYGIHQPEHINQSLFAWRSLLGRGYPLVKKHVLFQLLEHGSQPMAIAELAPWIPPDRLELLGCDIQQLLISRYSGWSPCVD